MLAFWYILLYILWFLRLSLFCPPFFSPFSVVQLDYFFSFSVCGLFLISSCPRFLLRFFSHLSNSSKPDRFFFCVSHSSRRGSPSPCFLNVQLTNGHFFPAMFYSHTPPFRPVPCHFAHPPFRPPSAPLSVAFFFFPTPRPPPPELVPQARVVIPFVDYERFRGFDSDKFLRSFLDFVLLVVPLFVSFFRCFPFLPPGFLPLTFPPS